MGASQLKNKAKPQNNRLKALKKVTKRYSDKDIVFFVVNNVHKNIPHDIILIIFMYCLPPPIESLQKLNDTDIVLFEAVKKHYGNKLDQIYPFVIRTFILGYSHVMKAVERERETLMRIDHYLRIHNKYKFTTILDNPLPNEDIMFAAWKIYTYGYDKQRHPVLYDEIGSCNITAIENAFQNDLDLVRKYRFRFHRRLANCKRIQSEKYDTMIFKHVMVMDLSGFSTSHFGSNYRKIVTEIIGDEQHLFPETLYKLYLINTPLAFRLIWKVLRQFIDPITFKKINVLGGSYINEMIKEIDIHQIPKKYKGKGIKPIKIGYCYDMPNDRYPLDYYDKINTTRTTATVCNDDQKQNDK